MTTADVVARGTTGSADVLAWIDAREITILARGGVSFDIQAYGEPSAPWPAAAVIVGADGSATGTSSAEWVASLLASTTGAAAGEATATGLAAARVSALGVSVGSGVCTGIGAARVTSTGVCGGSATCTGLAAAREIATGSAVGASACLALTDAIVGSAGASVGSATVTGIAGLVVPGSGTAVGTSAASASSEILTGAEGSASGTSVVVGVSALGPAAGLGHAVGTSVVTGASGVSYTYVQPDSDHSPGLTFGRSLHDESPDYRLTPAPDIAGLPWTRSLAWSSPAVRAAVRALVRRFYADHARARRPLVGWDVLESASYQPDAQYLRLGFAYRAASGDVGRIETTHVFAFYERSGPGLDQAIETMRLALESQAVVLGG